MTQERDKIQKVVNQQYAHGQHYEELTPLRSVSGLTEETIKKISSYRREPEFILDFRLRAYEAFRNKRFPQWSSLNIPDLRLDELNYFAEIDIPPEQKIEDIMVDLGLRPHHPGLITEFVVDSSSVFNNLQKKYEELGILVCSISEAIQKRPELVQKYLGSVVPPGDNYFSALNSAFFSDGTFVYIPEGVICPFDISTYFRLNTKKLGQFERTLIIAEKASSVSYLEGCTAPAFSEHQLHAAVVELVALDGASIYYSTVQNWYPGDDKGVGGVFNFVTKRGIAHRNAHINWTQVEVGAALTWKYPSVILLGNNSRGSFNSINVTKACQQADTGTKMIHLGDNSTSSIVAKTIVAGSSSSTYRGKVAISSRDSANISSCDSLILGTQATSGACPTLISSDPSSTIAHEATTTCVSQQQLMYLAQRGISEREAYNLVASGFCKTILQHLPLEFAIEAQQLLNFSLEDAIG